VTCQLGPVPPPIFKQQLRAWSVFPSPFLPQLILFLFSFSSISVVSGAVFRACRTVPLDHQNDRVPAFPITLVLLLLLPPMRIPYFLVHTRCSLLSQPSQRLGWVTLFFPPASDIDRPALLSPFSVQPTARNRNPSQTLYQSFRGPSPHIFPCSFFLIFNCRSHRSWVPGPPPSRGRQCSVSPLPFVPPSIYGPPPP